MPENTLFALRTDNAPGSRPLAGWTDPAPARIERYWDGRSAFYPPWHNLTIVTASWNYSTLYFHFDCCFERLQRREPDPEELWEGDVVEVFLRPADLDHYFEVEISPSGSSLAAIVHRPRIDVDFGWRPDLVVESRVDEEAQRWQVDLGIALADLGQAAAPRSGTSWRLNLTRIAGEAPRREYLSWRPTWAPEPDFHVPQCFGHLFFVEPGDPDAP